MNYYLTSQIIAQHQAAVAADVTHRAQVKEARAARRASTTAAPQPARIRRFFLSRPAHAA
jgi:hypothetical protein